MIYLCEVFVNDGVYVKKNCDIGHKSNGQQPTTNRERQWNFTPAINTVTFQKDHQSLFAVNVAKNHATPHGTTGIMGIQTLMPNVVIVTRETQFLQLPPMTELILPALTLKTADPSHRSNSTLVFGSGIYLSVVGKPKRPTGRPPVAPVLTRLDNRTRRQPNREKQ